MTHSHIILISLVVVWEWNGSTQIDPDLACIESLDSYEPLYRSLAPEFQPAAYKFWDSDYAFARERITSSPLFIKLVAELSDVPFTQSDVVGYNEITGGVSMAQLVAQERVSVVLPTSLYIYTHISLPRALLCGSLLFFPSSSF